MESRDRQVLDKILCETEVIVEILSGYDLGSFSCDEKTKRASCMTLVNPHITPPSAIKGWRNV